MTIIANRFRNVLQFFVYLIFLKQKKSYIFITGNKLYFSLVCFMKDKSVGWDMADFCRCGKIYGRRRGAFSLQ